jgi:hypothetical protein
MMSVTSSMMRHGDEKTMLEVDWVKTREPNTGETEGEERAGGKMLCETVDAEMAAAAASLAPSDPTV